MPISSEFRALLIVLLVAASFVGTYFCLRQTSPEAPAWSDSLEARVADVPLLFYAGEMRFSIPRSFSVSRSKYGLWPTGWDFWGGEWTETWLLFPKTFVKRSYLPSAYPEDFAGKTSFASLEIRPRVAGEITGSGVDILAILGLVSGKYPDGIVVNYELTSFTAIGSNAGDDTMYAYEYLVSESSEGKNPLVPMRRFAGIFWYHGERLYVLQDRTQTSAWFSKPVVTESVVRDALPMIARSAVSK